jgi:hypothetical protein
MFYFLFKTLKINSSKKPIGMDAFKWTTTSVQSPLTSIFKQQQGWYVIVLFHLYEFQLFGPIQTLARNQMNLYYTCFQIWIVQKIWLMTLYDKRSH